MSEPKEKRCRSANYTQEEKNLLLNSIFNYKSIIESKKTDAVTWREKEETWRKITDLFNTHSRTGIYRNTSSLKKAYDNIKKTTRKEVSDEKASIIRTGGGKSEIKKDPNRDLVLEIINKKTVYGLENVYDSDRQKSDNPTQCDNNDSCDSLQENIFEQQVDDEDIPIIFEVVEDNEDIEVDWGNYKPDNLKRPLDPKLVPKAKMNELPRETFPSQTTAKDSESCNSRWTGRNRPVISSLPSSELSKKYSQLVDLKIELTQLELTKVKNEYQFKKERDAEEFELRKRCLQLEVKIKQAFLEKIESWTCNPGI